MVSDDDKRRVARAIVDAEARTSGEIFVVVARQSDDYRFVAALWAALAALALPAILVFTDLSAGAIAIAQAVVAIGLGLLFQWEPLRFALVPSGIKRQRAHRMATETFLAHNIHATPGRTGLLLFVSVAERHAEVVADQAVLEAVDPDAWVGLIARLTARLREGAMGEALAEAIEAAGAILAVHVPPHPSGKRDHLPNTLVEL